MPKTRSQKSEAVAELVGALKGAQSAAFADYQGMSVQSITALRKKMHTEGVRYLVAKKTLLTRAAKDAGFQVDFKSYPGMIGMAIATKDEMAPSKLIGEAGKGLSIKLVGGIFEGNVVDKATIEQLSKLPSKTQLLTSLLYVLNGPMSGFARLLNAYGEQKNAGTPAPAPAPVVEAAAPVVEAAAEAPKAEEAAPAAEAAAEAPAPEAPASTDAPAA
ncbi:50S ribosomal protein L10 [Candidatus Uhrbacteria bacterium]|nr:50S ribosomal protein L10 [Candidatus Uhrbacteria bacterium]